MFYASFSLMLVLFNLKCLTLIRNVTYSLSSWCGLANYCHRYNLETPLVNYLVWL